MLHTQFTFWKDAPFIRLLLPFMAGIILYSYFPIEIDVLLLFCFSSFCSFLLLNFLPVKFTVKYFFIQSAVLQTLLIFFAMLIAANNYQPTHSSWYGHHIQSKDYLLVSLEETPIVKQNSIKAEAAVLAIVNADTAQPVFGKIILYFAKDSIASSLQYGQQMILHKPIQPISNMGNPGAFDFKAYAARQQLFHSVYLTSSDYILTDERVTKKLQQFLIETRTAILSIIRKNIRNNPQVLGIAEALLIGYKEDLDKDLVQAYSNTGVVHIIAISGLHLGLIYVMLSWIFKHLPWIKKSTTVKVVFILGFLWLFALLTGASASVLRSAVMFTTIVIGKFYFKQSSIYNALASSAFILLCYNPNFLWDVGFQLSYLAVYGIVWLQKPIVNLFFINTTWLRKIWEMASVTIAAQITTTPICLFYFHQFPNTFLFTNLITVPLSSVILFAEILLIICSPIPFLSSTIGEITYWLIYAMNAVILFFDGLPYSITDYINTNIVTTILLYFFVLAICAFGLYRKKSFLYVSLTNALLLAIQFIVVKIEMYHQQKIIVYNIPKKQAIDFVQNNRFVFVGDSTLQQSTSTTNFYLKPSRIFLGAKEQVNQLPGFYQENNLWQFDQTTILLINQSMQFKAPTSTVKIDILIISGNPNINLKNICSVISPSIVVFDATNSLWKIAQWKTSCEELLLQCFSVAEKGAFVYNAR